MRKSAALVSYLVNDEPFYLLMLLNSAYMLRRANRAVPVKALLVDDGRPASPTLRRVARILATMDVELDRVAPERVTGTPDRSFFINKIHWTRLVADRLLCLDADTFIFGDLIELFDAHAELDVYAAESRWVYSQPGWRRSLFGGVTPLNSGVVLWNHANARHWDIARHAPRVSSGRTPEGRFAKTLECHSLHEEFALSLSVAEHGLSYRTFNDGFVGTCFRPATDLPRQSLVFHAYSRFWLTTYRKVAHDADLPPFKKPNEWLDEVERRARAFRRLAPRAQKITRYDAHP